MLLDLHIFKLAQKARKEMPAAIKQMEKSITALLPYREFRPIATSIATLMQEKVKMQMQLEAAIEIEKKKARLR